MFKKILLALVSTSILIGCSACSFLNGEGTIDKMIPPSNVTVDETTTADVIIAVPSEEEIRQLVNDASEIWDFMSINGFDCIVDDELVVDKYYYPVRDYETKAELIAYLQEYFTDSLAEAMLSNYRDINGRLYAYVSARETNTRAGGSSLTIEYMDDNTVNITRNVEVWLETAIGKNYLVGLSPQELILVCEDNRWVFDVFDDSDNTYAYDFGEGVYYDYIPTLIDDCLDIIVSETELYSSEQEYIDAHPEAFAEIVALGDAALPYLDEISLETGVYYYNSVEAHRSLIAKTAAFAINPELYDFIAPSSDGKYAMVLRVSTFFSPEWGGGLTTAYNKAEIIDCISNDIIFSAQTNYREYGQYTHVGVEWSPDNAYVAIQSSDNKFYTTTEIYDVKNAKEIILPSIKNLIIPTVSSEFNFSTDIKFDYTSISLDSWPKNDVVNVNFMFRYGNAFTVQGAYSYNINEQRIFSITSELYKDISE